MHCFIMSFCSTTIVILVAERSDRMWLGEEVWDGVEENCGSSSICCLDCFSTMKLSLLLFLLESGASAVRDKMFVLLHKALRAMSEV